MSGSAEEAEVDRGVETDEKAKTDGMQREPDVSVRKDQGRDPDEEFRKSSGPAAVGLGKLRSAMRVLDDRGWTRFSRALTPND